MKDFFYVGGGWRWGVWCVRVGPIAVLVKAPWNRPLFSERHRCKVRVLPLPGGWRFLFRWQA